MGRILLGTWCWFFICIAAQTSWTLAASASQALCAERQGAPATPLSSGVPTVYQTLSEHVRGTVTLGVGMRFDRLDWSIAGTAAGTNPNIRSELAWSDLTGHQLALSAKALVGRHFYGRGHVNYAWIRGGDLRDSDYGGDNRAQEWSRSISETNDDALWDVMLGAGYPFTFKQRRLLLAPLVGGSIHKQNLRITNGQQVLSAAPPPGFDPPRDVGPLDSRLDSLYEARWIGLWSGIDLRYQLAAPPNAAPLMEWGLCLAYHFWADYSAEANWNLREDLRHPVSFEHDAEGSGISLQAEWLIRAGRYLNVTASWNYCRWETDPGKSTFFEAEGSERIQRLNEVTWDSQSIMLGLTLRFY